MFSRLTRLPLRRCLHTPPNRLGFTVGASAAVAATYLTWRLTSDSHSIALDSATKFSATQQHSVSSPSEPILRSSPVRSENPAASEPILEVELNTTPKTFEASDATAEAPPTNAEGEPSPDEAGSAGAFNPVTGEINWDCPCLGGMAHGPCGPQFREAFSCFVFSEDEPKGINCVEKFKAMQDCFREHPEIYADEIMDDDDDDDELVREPVLAAESTIPEGVVLAPSDVDDNKSTPDPAQKTTKPKPRKERHSETSV